MLKLLIPFQLLKLQIVGFIIRSSSIIKMLFALKVLIGGEECAVQSVTDTQITCLTSTQPSTTRSLYPGGRGFVFEVFPGESDITATLDSSSAGGAC